jgi:hypothetical protein
MQKFSLEPNKTIIKKARPKPSLKEYYNSPSRIDTHLNPAILRSKSLPNNSEINFKKDEIADITNLNRSSSKNLSSSTSLQQKIETGPNSTYTSSIINQIIDLNTDNHSSEATHAALSGAEED